MRDPDLHGKLDDIAARAPHTEGIMIDATRFCWQIFRRHLTGERVLELGPAEGVMTELMLAQGLSVTAVEGSPVLASALAERQPRATVHCELFEDFLLTGLFDAIVMGHVLEHVEDPLSLLSRLRQFLVDGSGRVLASVPNAQSFHRLAAVEMGLLRTPYSLNSSDVAHGHLRIFDTDSFHELFWQSGYEIEEWGGYWLKTLSNSQIEEWYTPEMISAFMKIGESFPRNSGELYVIAKPKSV